MTTMNRGARNCWEGARRSPAGIAALRRTGPQPAQSRRGSRRSGAPLLIVLRECWGWHEAPRDVPRQQEVPQAPCPAASGGDQKTQRAVDSPIAHGGRVRPERRKGKRSPDFLRRSRERKKK